MKKEAQHNLDLDEMDKVLVEGPDSREIGLSAAELALAASPDLLSRDKYPSGELFICDVVSDVAFKDMMAQMEHPFYSLSKRPDTKPIKYVHGDSQIVITPSINGLATIYDKDILIYCISHLMARKNRGEAVTKRIRINTRELLMFINRGTGGADYRALVAAFDRLEGTRIRTTIVTGGVEQTEGFGLIDRTGIKREKGLEGRMLYCDITLSDWVFNAIQGNEVLSLSRDYFRLKKPLERRVYELARKHCGSQKEWSIGLSNLHTKSGSRGPLKTFRLRVKELVKYDHLPDYEVSFDSKKDMVRFRNRVPPKPYESMARNDEVPSTPPTDLVEEAKGVAPRMDIHALWAEWYTWNEVKGAFPEAWARAFIGFCRAKAG